MFFGDFPDELRQGATNAVQTCLGIKAGEHVALIADQASRDVAAAIEQALADQGAITSPILIESVTARPMTTAPAAILDALEQADAGILCVQPQEGELGSRMAIVAVVERRRIRYAHMVGVTSRIMQEGMRADYRQVDRLSQELCERMQHATSLTVKTAAGTDFRATFDHSLVWVKTSGIINPRYWSNLPAGEVFTTPGSVDGTFICDGTAGDYFNAKYGELKDEPAGARDSRRTTGRRAVRPQGPAEGFLGLLSHRRQQRACRRTRLRHQPRAAGDDRDPCSRTKRCPASTLRLVTPTAVRRTPTGSQPRTSTCSPVTATCGSMTSR